MSITWPVYISTKILHCVIKHSQRIIQCICNDDRKISQYYVFSDSVPSALTPTATATVNISIPLDDESSTEALNPVDEEVTGVSFS